MRDKVRFDFNSVIAAALAGLAVGALVMGLAARVAMRLVAMLGGLQPGFTVAGTVGIMVIAAVLGLATGLVYGVVRPFIPLRGLGKGLGFGLALAALISVPFLRDPAGELALASPVVGATLFGAIGLVYALALEAVLLRWDYRRAISALRPAHLIWLGLVACFLALALRGMATLMVEFARFPPAASAAYLAVGLDFQEAHQLHALLMLAFAVAYTALVVGVLLKSGERWVGRLAALALAVLAAGWFSELSYPATSADGPGAAALVSGLAKAGGWALLLLAMVLWPDGQFRYRWTRVVFVLWCMWLAFWLLTPAGRALAQPAALTVTATGLVAGVLALTLRLRDDPTQRRQIAPVLAGYGLAVVWLLALWLAAVRQPAMQVFQESLPATLFAFAPYLLPWLLLPASLLAALHPDQAQSTADGQRIDLPDQAGEVVGI